MWGLSPRDEYALAEAPVVTVVSPAATTPTKLLGADPDRFVVVFGSSGQVFIAPTGKAAANVGFIAQAGSAVLLTTELYGALVGSGWDVFAPGAGVTVNAISVSLRRDPEMYGYRDVFKRATGILGGARLVRPGRAVGTAKGGALPPGMLRQLRERYPGVWGAVED